MLECIISSLAQTARFGKLLGSFCLPGDVICLGGELGAGKTTLTQFLAEGIGVDPKEYITSPTFSLYHQYNGRLQLNHMDFYRLHSSDEVLEIGLDEYFYQDGVTVIEWYQNALDVIPDAHLLVELEWVDECCRKIRCSSSDTGWQHRIALLSKRLEDRPA